MLRRLRLGQDLDGVIYRWSDTARYLLDQHFGENPGESQNYNWIQDHVSKEAWDWLWKDGVTKHGLFRYGSLYKGSREFLDRIKDFCDIVVITARPASAVLDTMDWLAYQKLPISEVHIVGPRDSKATIKPECDVYIDDAAHNATDLLENTANSIIVMPDRPWNQEHIFSFRFHRTHNWEEIERVLRIEHEQINREK